MAHNSSQVAEATEGKAFMNDMYSKMDEFDAGMNEVSTICDAGVDLISVKEEETKQSAAAASTPANFDQSMYESVCTNLGDIIQSIEPLLE